MGITHILQHHSSWNMMLTWKRNLRGNKFHQNTEELLIRSNSFSLVKKPLWTSDLAVIKWGPLLLSHQVRGHGHHRRSQAWDEGRQAERQGHGEWDQPKLLRTNMSSMDCRCEDGCFSVSAIVTILNRDSLSSSETGVNSGGGTEKCAYLNELIVSEPLVASISSQISEDLRHYYLLVQNLAVSNPGLKVVSSNLRPAWTVQFLGWCSEFSAREVSRPMKWTLSLLLIIRRLFSVFTSRVYGHLSFLPYDCIADYKSNR